MLEETHCFYIQGILFYHQQEGSIFLQNAGTFPTDCMMLHPRSHPCQKLECQTFNAVIGTVLEVPETLIQRYHSYINVVCLLHQPCSVWAITSTFFINQMF